MAYLSKGDVSAADVPSSLLDEAQKEQSDVYTKLAGSNGSENPYALHAELGDLMWNNCGIWRVQADLLMARTGLDELAGRARQCGLTDSSGWTNQAVPFTRALINMIEQSKANRRRRNHPRLKAAVPTSKMDTPERSDTDWLKTTLASYDSGKTKFEFEPIDCRFIAPRARKYAVNQIGIVKKIMGENFLEGFASAKK